MSNDKEYQMFSGRNYIDAPASLLALNDENVE